MLKLKIITIFQLFFIYILFYILTLNFSKSLRWCKVLGLWLSSYIYLLILRYLFTFNCFSIKFQNLEAYALFQDIKSPKYIDGAFFFKEGFHSIYSGVSKKVGSIFSTADSASFNEEIISYFFCYYGIDSISLVFLLLISFLIPLVIIINWEQSVFPFFLLNSILFLEFCLLNLFWVLDFFFFFFFLK